MLNNKFQTIISITLVSAFALWPAPVRHHRTGQVLFNNDAPLGLVSSQAHMDASTWESIISGEGYWNDLNWIGNEMPGGWITLAFIADNIVNIVVHLQLLLALTLFWLTIKYSNLYALLMERKGKWLTIPLIFLLVNEFEVGYAHPTIRLFFYFAVLFLLCTFMEKEPKWTTSK